MSDGAWLPDPTGRNDYRWKDGEVWSEHVSNSGTVGTDAMTAPPAPAPAPAPVSAPAPASADALADGPPPPSMSATAQPAPAPTPAPTPNPSRAGTGSAGGISGGVMGDGYDEEEFDRVGLQNSKLLKIRLGQPVMIKRGSMVAYQGQMTFEAVSEGGGIGSLIKRAVSDNALMARAEGQGDLFVADDGDEVHLIQLDGGSLMVNGPSLLAFENTLQFETVRFSGAGLMTGGGLFGMKLTGTGWVAVTCHGTPVRLDTTTPTFVDAQAAVAWSGNVPMSVNIQKLSIKSMRSGEIAQMAFQPGGFVLVQASEGPSVPTHAH